jgi:hypothetical protein
MTCGPITLGASGKRSRSDAMRIRALLVMRSFG